MIDISNIGDVNESKATQTKLHLLVNVNKMCVRIYRHYTHAQQHRHKNRRD